MSHDSMKYILQPGSTVFTQCFPNDDWTPNTVKNVEGSIVIINLNDYYFRKGVMVGDSISIRCTFADIEYILEGEVSEIDIYDAYTISIFINNVNTYKNRRKHFRYYAKLGASLKSNQEEKGTYSIITNISLTGLALISKANIELNNSIVVDLFISSKNILSLNGIVVRRKALNYGHEYGISFAEINNVTKEKLDKLIDKLESDIMHY